MSTTTGQNETGAERTIRQRTPMQVHPLTRERALILGNHLDRLIGFNAAGSRRLFDVFEHHITKPENNGSLALHRGDVGIRDNRATQH